MPEFIGALIYDSSINLAGLERDKREAINKFHSIGREATRTFENEIARSLAKSVRPEVFAGDLAKSRALLQGFGDDATKIFDRALGRQAARRMFQPFIDETKTLTGQLKGILATNFSPRNLLLGVAGGIGLERIGTELVNFGKDAVVFAADFETSLTKIRTIADRGTDIDEIGERLQVLSTKIPQDLLTLSEGLFNIIGSGISDSAEALKVLDVAARAATAGFTDTKFAADAIVFAINAFGKSAEDAEDIADTLFATVDAGKIEFKDLATNIGEVANPAAIAGVSLEELGQAIATLTIGGTPVSETFTALKNFLQSIIAPTEGARKAAQEFGLDFSKAGIAAAGGLENFAQKLREVTGGDTQKLDKLFPEARALRAAQILTNTLADTYVRLGNEAFTASSKAGKMQEALEDVNDSATAQAKIFTNNLKLATLELGKGFLEVLKPALKAVNQGFIESENAAGKYVKSVIGLTKLLGNPQLAALLGFGAIIKGGQPQSNIPVLDEVEVIAERVQAVSDGVETLSAAAENTADEFERAEEVLARMGDIGKQFQDFQRGAEKARKNFEAEQDEFERFQKEISQAAEAQKEAKKERAEFLQEGKDDLEEFLRKEADRLRQRQEVIKQSTVDLADLVDQRLGDITASFLRFFDAIKTQSASGFSNLIGGFGVFDTIVKSLFGKGFFESIFGGIFGSSNAAAQSQRDELARLEREQQYASERAAEQNERLTQSLKDLKDALVGAELSTVELETAIRTNLELLQLFAPTLNNAMLTPLQEAIKLFLASGRKVPETVLELDAFLRDILVVGNEAQKAAAAELLKILSTADAATREALLKAFGGLIAGLQGLSDFGKNVGREFDALIDRLNIKFDLLNIDDPLKKLDLLSKGIRDKFKAIIPTTDAGIRDLIAKGLEALEAGGQTLVDFLKSLDLEELTADQFRDLLQLLNQLANEAKNKVDGINDIASESVISQVRLATFEQTNALIDNTVTMRIVLTNILDAELQMLELARRNLGLTGAGGIIPGAQDRFFFFNDGVISETSIANLSSLQRRMYNEAVAQAGGKGQS